MKNFTLTVMLCIAIPSFAQYINIIDNSNWNTFKGHLSNMAIEVTPEEHAARVDIKFDINIDSTDGGYGGQKPDYTMQFLESRMSFQLPREAYFYDSYLWLNATTIIRAKLMGNSEASRIYDSIVGRKTDPSILRMYDYGGPNINYTFDVFPISTTYSRMVSLSYAIPYQFSSGIQKYISLPTSIMNMLHPDQKALLVVKKTNSTQILLTNQSDPTRSNTSASVTFELQKTNPSNSLIWPNEASKGMSFEYQMLDNIGYYTVLINSFNIPEISKSTSVFQLSVPMKDNGFTVNQITSNSNLSPNNTLLVAGRCFGEIDTTKPMTLNYVINNTAYQSNLPIQTIVQGKHVVQDWTKMIMDQYPLDTALFRLSLYHRVLTKQSAFLALENGDTVGSNKDNDWRNPGGATLSITRTVSKEPETITIYPNPFSDKINLETSSNIEDVYIYNMLGQEVYHTKAKYPTTHTEIQLSDLGLKDGIYWVVVVTKDGQIKKQIVKQSN